MFGFVSALSLNTNRMVRLRDGFSRPGESWTRPARCGRLSTSVAPFDPVSPSPWGCISQRPVHWGSNAGRPSWTVAPYNTRALTGDVFEVGRPTFESGALGWLLECAFGSVRKDHLGRAVTDRSVPGGPARRIAWLVERLLRRVPAADRGTVAGTV